MDELPVKKPKFSDNLTLKKEREYKSNNEQDILYQLDCDRKEEHLFCDVIFKNHVGSFFAHKCVLLSSDFLKNLSVVEDYSSLAVETCEVLSSLVDFIYNSANRQVFSEANAKFLLELDSYLKLENIKSTQRNILSNQHKTNFSSILHRLVENKLPSKYLSDVTLKCDNKLLFAHKCIIGSISNNLKKMLSEAITKSKENVLEISGISYSCLKEILTFVYTGSLLLSENNIFIILSSVNFIDIPFIKHCCSDFLKYILNCDNIFLICGHAHTYNMKDVLVEAGKLFISNLHKLIHHDGFQSLEFTVLIEFVQFGKKISSEEDLCKAVVHWTKFDLTQRIPHFLKLFQCIGSQNLSKEFISKCMKDVQLQCEGCAAMLLAKSTECILPEKRSEFVTINFKCHLTPIPHAIELTKYDIHHLDNKIYISCCHLPSHIYDSDGVDYESLEATPALTSLTSSIFVIGIKGKVAGSINLLDKNIKWVEMPSLLEFRSQSNASSLENKIYVCGGLDENHEPKSSCEYFDILSNIWVNCIDMEEARACHSMITVNSSLFVIGGLSSHSYLDSVEYYTSILNKWKSLSSMDMYRYSMTVVEYRNEIFVIGGTNEDDDCCKTVCKYNPVMDTWTNLSDLNKVCESSIAFVVEDSLFVFSDYNTVEKYDSDSDLWIILTAFSLDPSEYEYVFTCNSF